MRKSPKDISNRILLQHMQGMKYSLESQIDKLESRLDGLESGTKRIENDLGAFRAHCDVRFAKIEDALQRLYGKRLEMVVQIERLKKRVGIA